MTEIERREFLKSTGVALAGVAVLSNASCNRQTEIRNPTREELLKRLEKLAKSKPPRNLSLGAMCYEMAIPPRVEKPCPDCNRPMIVGEKDEFLRKYNVPLKRIQDQGVNATLIIPDHCSLCGFGLGFFGLTGEQRYGGTPPDDWTLNKIRLEIQYPDQREPVRVELDSAFDLELMVLFLHGKTRCEAGFGREEALKDKVERLKELFGVKE